MYRSITTRQIENGTKRRNLLAKKCFRPDFFFASVPVASPPASRQINCSQAISLDLGGSFLVVIPESLPKNSSLLELLKGTKKDCNGR